MGGPKKGRFKGIYKDNKGFLSISDKDRFHDIWIWTSDLDSALKATNRVSFPGLELSIQVKLLGASFLIFLTIGAGRTHEKTADLVNI